MTKVIKSSKTDIEIVLSDSEFAYARKKPTISLRQDNVSTKVASFNNQKSFEWFVGIMELMLCGKEIEIDD